MGDNIYFFTKKNCDTVLKSKLLEKVFIYTVLRLSLVPLADFITFKMLLFKSFRRFMRVIIKKGRLKIMRQR